LFRERTQDATGKVHLGEIKIDQAKAATIKQIFNWALAGWGRRRLAQQLTADKTPTVSGQSETWNAESLKVCILRNVAVIGHYQILDEATGKPTGEIVKNMFPPVIDEKTFYSVQAMTSKVAERSAPARSASMCLTTGLTHCPTCGGPMEHRTCQHGPKTYRYLVCQNNKAGRATNPECKRQIKYPQFEASLLGLLSRSTKVQALLGHEVVQPTKIAELRGKVTEADRKANNIAKRIEDDDDAPKMLVERLKQVMVEAEALRGELLAEEAKAKAVTTPQVAYDKFVNELAAHVGEPEYRERVKTALRDIVERIDFNALDAYTITFRTGTKYRVEMMANGVSMDFKL
jgi:hypothetical protein